MKIEMILKSKYILPILLLCFYSITCSSCLPIAIGLVAGGPKLMDKMKKKKEKVELPIPLAQPKLTDGEERRFNYYYLEAIRMKQQQKYDAAFDLLQHCLSINPCSPTALYEVAQYHVYLKQTEQGMRALEKAVEYAPDNYWYSQGLVNLYMQQKDTEKAVGLLKIMKERFPTKLDPVYMLLDIYNRNQQYEDMLAILNGMEERTGKSEQLSMEKFRIYMQMEDEKKSLREIKSLTEEYPMEPRYKVMLGDVYLQRGKHEKACEQYDKVLSEEPDNAMALYSKLNYYEATGQTGLYNQQLDTLLLNPKVESATKLGIMRQLVVRDEQAGKDSTRVITLFNRIMEQEPEEIDLPLLYVQYLLSKQMNDEALPVLNQVLDIDPTYAAARMTLLNDAIRKENYEEITRLSEGGVAANPEMLEFYFYLAIAYNRDERTDDAIDICLRGLLQVTSETNKEIVADFYSILGDCYHAKKENERAYEAYEKALQNNPNNIPVLNNYAYYLSVERRDLDKAEEMSYKTVKAEPNNATYLDTYAWILFEKGNYAEARIYIDEAMKHPEGYESDVVVEHCGDIYYMSGDVEGALKYWKKALELGSKSELLKKKIETKSYVQE